MNETEECRGRWPRRAKRAEESKHAVCCAATGSASSAAALALETTRGETAATALG